MKKRQRFEISYSDYDVYDWVRERERYDAMNEGREPNENIIPNEWDFQDYLDMFLYALGLFLKERLTTDYIHVRGYNLNWRHSDGYKYAELDLSKSEEQVAREFVNAIAPDCNFSITVRKAKRGVGVTIYHHDCPMGSTYVATSVKQSTYEREWC